METPTSDLKVVGEDLGELTLRISLNLLGTIREILENSKDDRSSSEIWKRFSTDPTPFHRETFYLSLFIVDWWLSNQGQWNAHRNEMMDHIFLFCHRISATPKSGKLPNEMEPVVWLESPEYQRSMVEFVEAMKHEDPNNLGPLYWINKRALMRILSVGEEVVKLHLPANIALQETEIAGVKHIEECLGKFRPGKKSIWQRFFGK